MNWTLATCDRDRARRGRRTLSVLALLGCIVAMLVAGAGSALAGPVFGPIGVSSGSYVCGGGGAIGQGGYTTRWTSDTQNGSKCDWETGSMGAGTRVSTMSFSWSTSLGSGNSNNRYVQFGVAGGSGMVSRLWGSIANTPQIPYSFDVSGQNVGVAATRHLSTANAAPSGTVVNLGNTTTAGLNYTYEDLYAPTVNWMSAYPASSANGWWTGPVFVDFQTSDNAYFYGNTEVFVDGAGYQAYSGACAPYQGAPCYTNLSGVLLDPGPDGAGKVVRVRRLSGGGWGNGEQAVGFNLDRYSPSAPGIAGAGYTSGTWTNQPVTVAVTAPSHDNAYGSGSGVTGYSWSSGQSGIASTYSADGIYHVSARALDGAGHQSADSNNVDVMIDTVAPPTPALTGAPAPGDWATAPPTLTIGLVTDPGAPASAGVDQTSGYQSRTRTSADGVSWSGWSVWTGGREVTVSTEGFTEVAARTVDRAGNTNGDVATQIVKLDSTAPSTPEIQGDEGWHCAPSETVSAGESDDPAPGSGFTYQYRVKGPGDPAFGPWQAGDSVTVSAEGQTEVQFRALDGAGNASAPATTLVRLDCGIPGDVTITGGDLAWQSVAQIDFTAHADDAVSGVDHYIWQLSTDGGQTWVGVPGQLAGRIVADEGETRLRAKAVDRAGNESANWAPVEHRGAPGTPNGDATARIDRSAPGDLTLLWSYRAQADDSDELEDRTSATDPGFQRAGTMLVAPDGPQRDFGPVRLGLAAAGTDAVSGLHPAAPYDVAQPTGDACPAPGDPAWDAWDGTGLPRVDVQGLEGVFLACFRSRDAAGNLSPVASGHIRVDTTAAAPARPAGGNGSWQQGTSTKVTVATQLPADPDACLVAKADSCANVGSETPELVSGLTRFEYQMRSGGGPWGATAPLDADPSSWDAAFYLTDGQWQVRSRSVDAAGNRSDWTEMSGEILLAKANRTLVRSWGLGTLESALCRLPSVRHTVDIELCGQSVGGPDWDRRHIWVP